MNTSQLGTSILAAICTRPGCLPATVATASSTNGCTTVSTFLPHSLLPGPRSMVRRSISLTPGNLVWMTPDPLELRDPLSGRGRRLLLSLLRRANRGNVAPRPGQQQARRLALDRSHQLEARWA